MSDLSTREDHLADHSQDALPAKELVDATHLHCDLCEAMVPLHFSGFCIPGETTVGGDLLCSQCGFVIATVSRPAEPGEIENLRTEQEQALARSWGAGQHSEPGVSHFKEVYATLDSEKDDHRGTERLAGSVPASAPPGVGTEQGLETLREHLETIAYTFNEFMHQLELGDHRDSMDHRVLMNGRLRALRNAIAGASLTVDVISVEDARALANQIAAERKRREC